MVRSSTYQQVPTPSGLKAIEENSLEYFSNEMYGNFNTGVLEQYLEEKTRRDGFRISRWPWKAVLWGIIIGMLFTVIIEFVSLKVGLVISGTWYLMFVVGLAFRWNASDTNISASAATSASYMATGFVFTFPAMYLLAYSPNYAAPDGSHVITHIPSLAVPLVAGVLAAWLGTVYFIIFRRIWLIDDPLPVPSFESNVKLLEIVELISTRGGDSARRSVRGVMLWTGLTTLFVFLRDWPVGKTAQGEVVAPLDLPFRGAMDHPESSAWGGAGIIQTPPSWPVTSLSFQIEPILLSLGWFMRTRVAFLFSAGSLLSWAVIVPLAIMLQVPVFVNHPAGGLPAGFYSPLDQAAPSLSVFSAIARPMGIGCILGGGVTALVRMSPAFKRVGTDMRKAAAANRGEGPVNPLTADYIPKRGWYDWPLVHIPLMAAVTLVGTIIIFTLGGYPVAHSVLFAIVLVLTAFFIGAIAVKVMGEIGTEPVSGTSFIVLLMLISIFWVIDLATEGHLNAERTAVMAIIGTTTFAGAISMSGNIVTDFKTALYVGNRPYHMINSMLWAIIPGAIPAALGAAFLSKGLALGILDLPAPQANAYATLLLVIFGGQSNGLLLQYLATGIVIGVTVDLLCGMGTSFGLGMYFPLYIVLPAFAGGIMRDVWQYYKLDSVAAAEGWDETKRTLKLVDSYIMATGWLIGASLAGTVVAIYLVALGPG